MFTTPRRHNVRIAAQECSRGFFSLLPTQLLCAIQRKDLDIGDPHNVFDIFEHLNIRWIHKSMFLHTAHRTRRVLCSQKLKNNQSSDDFAKIPVCAPHTVSCLRGLSRSRCRSLPTATAKQVCLDPKLLWGWMADCGKQMGGSPNASQQHLAEETSLLGVKRSPTAVARAPQRQE